jgi:molybdenum cofactor cytidylyltransferase
MKHAIVILAAGRSSRLGQPKQLLPFKGTTLIGHCITTARNVAENVIVVTGAGKMQVDAEVGKTGVVLIHNEAWEEGMASSIRCGLSYLTEHFTETNSVIFMVCDQPFVTAELLQDMIREKERSGKAIVASFYSDITGTPVLFDKTIFPELMALKGDIGARKIILKDKERTATVAFPLGNVDMDTADDYKKLLMQKDLI